MTVKLLIDWPLTVTSIPITLPWIYGLHKGSYEVPDTMAAFLPTPHVALEVSLTIEPFPAVAVIVVIEENRASLYMPMVMHPIANPKSGGELLCYMTVLHSLAETGNLF